MATAKKAQVKSAKPVVKPVKMSSVVATPAPKLPTPRLPLTLKKLQEQNPMYICDQWTPWGTRTIH